MSPIAHQLVQFIVKCQNNYTSFYFKILFLSRKSSKPLWTVPVSKSTSPALLVLESQNHDITGISML